MMGTRSEEVVRLTLVTLSALTLVVAATLAPWNRDSPNVLPSWIPKKLDGLTIRPAKAKDLPATRQHAVEAVRLRLLFADLPKREPESFPTLVTGRVIPKGLVEFPQSGRVKFPKVENAPAWLIIWRGIERGDDLMDAVIFVDGLRGECCLRSPLFLSGPARLG